MTNDRTPSAAQRMRAALVAGLAPESLEIIDDSHKHANHFVHPGGAGHQGETHFTVRIVSSAFAGKSRVERHRLVNALLAEELAAGVHALALQTKAPGE
jgi:BolA protein